MKPPLIVRSNLTPGDEGPRYWCLTKYTTGKLGAVSMTDVTEKWDVTDQVETLINEAAEDAIRRAAEAVRAAEARG